MLNVGPAEFLIIGLVLLIAVGPEQLPSVIRKVGQTVGQLKGMTDGLRSEFMAGLDELERNVDMDQWRSSSTDSSASSTRPSKPATASFSNRSPNGSSTSRSSSPESSPEAVDDASEAVTDPDEGSDQVDDVEAEREGGV